MIIDGDVPRTHGAHHEASRRDGRVILVDRHEGLGQRDGAVERAFAGHPEAACARWQMLREGILDDLEQGRRVVASLDLHLVQQLDHEAGESFVGARDPNGGMHVDEHLLRRGDVDLEVARLVERRIKQGQQFLMQNIGTVGLGILLQFAFAQITVIVAVEQFVHALAVLDRFEGRQVQQDDDRWRFAVIRTTVRNVVVHADLEWCASEAVACGRIIVVVVVVIRLGLFVGPGAVVHIRIIAIALVMINFGIGISLRFGLGLGSWHRHSPCLLCNSRWTT
mmetsp:Transcript_14946/g.41410  ORF Transcript_14946/g.41410 Transcript_14946/m.41410 type:complete len:280 (+) Transcript_14946:447-1286(+)